MTKRIDRHWYHKGSAVIEIAMWLPFVIFFLMSIVSLATLIYEAQERFIRDEERVRDRLEVWTSDAQPLDRPCLEEINDFIPQEVTFVVDPICDR